MILDSELEVPTAYETYAENIGAEAGRSKFFFSWSVALLFLAVVILLQVASGAYRSEFSGYPDEPAHYVTSLMVRDYLTHFHLQSPLKFAESYYHHYPKVAFGHWPPFFYVVQALWMLLFSASRVSVRIEIAITTALLAYSVFSEARRWFGPKLAILGGLLTVSLPLVQTYSAEEMSEVLLTLLCFWSCIYFARYLGSERFRDGAVFGLFFSLAVLTKGNGWLLAAVPPIALLLTRRYNLVFRRSFWIPFALIAVLCLPWQLMTMRMAERGWEGGSRPTLKYTLHALVEFLGIFPQILGPVLLGLMLCGVVSLATIPLLKGSISARSAVMLALILSVWVFHSLVPAGVEDRKLIIAVPAMLLFALGGVQWIINLVPRTSRAFRWRLAGAGTLLMVSFLGLSFQIPHVPHFGYKEAAVYLTQRPELRQSTILVSSQAGGEGMLISEVAMAEPHPQDTILRGTKSLARVDWNGAGYHCAFTDSGALLHFLKDEKVQVVIVDTFAPQVQFPHDELLKRTIRDSGAFVFLKAFRSEESGNPGEVRIYQLVP